MSGDKRSLPGMPTRDQIMDFITKSREPAGKREIARAFGLKGQEKISLKALLKDMADEGLIDLGPGRAFHKLGGLPKVTVLRIADHDGHSAFAVPEKWEADVPPPRVRVIERGKRGALGTGDRILARIEEVGQGYQAQIIRKLEASQDTLIGVIEAEPGPSGKPLYWLRSVDKKLRRDWPVSDINGAEEGDLVLAELGGRPPRQMARVTERLGDPFQPRSLSLIAIHKYGLPHHFSDAVEADAARVSKLPVDDPVREDLTHIPIVAIDPRDARDHDDAIWATPDDSPENPNGYKAIVAIADVSCYVRSGSPLDREARRRGNSVYFPDRVIPMLPHILSSGVCSLKQGEDRAAIVCHLVIDAKGKVTSWRFARAKVRLAANIAYEDAQAAIDEATRDKGASPSCAMPPVTPFDPELVETALKPLWACWKALAKARDAREPLDLDLPERQVMLDEKGRIAEVRVRERLDAHRLVEDFMIAANVAAAKALEAKKAPVMYRVHEVPAREKLVALKEFLATYDVSFALGQVVTPKTFNQILNKFTEEEPRQRVMEQVLRTQTQAYYAPVNAGHFGLALGSYGHFTSPIRRYADLLVHRSLVGAYGLDLAKPKDKDIPASTQLSSEDASSLARVGELISAAERRAMEAERETIDRYVAAYLSEQIGQILTVRITGVQNFGFFAQVDGIGGDAFVPVSALGDHWFHHDEAHHRLTSDDGSISFEAGQRLSLRLIEANPLTGSLMMAPVDADPEDVQRGPRGRGALRRQGGKGSGPRGGKSGGKPTGSGPQKTRVKPGAKGKHMVGKRGRPGNIRHQSR